MTSRFSSIHRIRFLVANAWRKISRSLDIPRHCFALRSFKKLEANGIHLNDAVPYLSVYLGHNKLKETEKYLQFSSEMYPEELKHFDTAMEALLPDDDIWNNVYEGGGSMKKESSFLALLENWLTSYLPDQEGKRGNTIKSYRDSWRVFIQYMYEQKHWLQ